MSLKTSCIKLENALKHNGQSDTDGTELCIKLKLLGDVLLRDMVGRYRSLDIFKDLDCFSV